MEAQIRKIAEILSDDFERVVVTKGARRLLRGGSGYSLVGPGGPHRHGSSPLRKPTRHRSTLINPARSPTRPTGGVEGESRPTKGGGVGEQQPVLTQAQELTGRTAVRALQEEQDFTRRAGRADLGSPLGQARGDAGSLGRAGTTVAGRMSCGTYEGLERLQQLYAEGEQRRQAKTVSK